MYKMAALGDKDSILSFKALGIETIPVTNTEDARRELTRMGEEGYAVIYMTEQVAAKLESEVERYADSPFPAVILIPGEGESLGIGLANVKDAVKRAVGADILGE